MCQSKIYVGLLGNSSTKFDDETYNTRGIASHDLITEDNAEGVEQGQRLFLSNHSTCLAVVKRADGVRLIRLG